MLKFVAPLSAALIVGWALVGSTTTASARARGCCGPLPPSYTYKTEKVHKTITRYRDVYRTKYVKRIKPIVHVTRIQPIIRIHNVTRVHTRIVGVVRPVHKRVTQRLPVWTYVTSVAYPWPHCACSPYRGY
jgi:hypothetical protein